MPNPNRSKYPEIIVDKDANMASGSLNTHHLTVEEYYDLLHHTHGFSDLVDDEGTSINELVEIVDETAFIFVVDNIGKKPTFPQ